MIVVIALPSGSPSSAALPNSLAEAGRVIV